MRLLVVVGARPDVVKAAPLFAEFARAGVSADVAFTRGASQPGVDLSTGTFYGVELPAPRWYFDLDPESGAAATGCAMQEFERLFDVEHPDAVLVIGDDDPALAGAISAAKAGIPVVHLGAGLRCGDLSVPDEINRVLVARVAAMHLTPTERALENLEDEGINPERIHFVGNPTAEFALQTLESIGPLHSCFEFGLKPKGYVVGSFRRAENLADPVRLAAILGGLGRSPLPVLLPGSGLLVRAAETFGMALPASARVSDMLPYRSTLVLTRDAAACVTDCAGLQEEACVVSVPCITVRPKTEFEATIAVGANRLCAASADDISASIVDTLGRKASWVAPKRWDRAVSGRVVRALRRGITPLS